MTHTKETYELLNEDMALYCKACGKITTDTDAIRRRFCTNCGLVHILLERPLVDFLVTLDLLRHTYPEAARKFGI